MYCRCNLVIRGIIFIIFLSLLMSCGKPELTPEGARRELFRLNIQYNEKSFYDAIINNDIIIINLFMKAGMNPNMVFSEKDAGLTPLIISVMRNNLYLVKLLLDNGADINGRYFLRTDITNALYYSILTMNVDITKLLLNKGINRIFKLNNRYITAYDYANNIKISKKYMNYLGNTIEMDSEAGQKAENIITLLEISLKGEIDLIKVMQFIYNNYNDKTNESIWTHICVPKEMDNNNFYQGQNYCKVTKLFDYRYTENGQDRYLLVTKTIPGDSLGDFSGHVCTPLISGFFFMKQGDQWVLEIKDYNIGLFGSYGKAPKPKIIKVGPDKNGIVLEDEDSHIGLTRSTFTILAPVKSESFSGFVAASLEPSENYVQNAGKVSEKDYKYIVTYEFIEGKNKDYYDIKVMIKGTKPNESSKHISPIDKIEYYKFINNKYIKIQDKNSI